MFGKWLIVALVALPMTPGLAQTTSKPAQTPEKPVDNGPAKPGANDAYQGGGVTLQGAPGAAAPTPKATPDGQAPANSVHTK